jgi:hypothetical protein
MADMMGISSRQGSHEVAQKLTMITLPRQAASFFSRPARSGRASGGVDAVQGAQSGPVAFLSASSLAARA